jgi:hypothetical protein
MLHLGINGLAGMLTGALLMLIVPWLEAQHAADMLSYEPVWLLALAGVLLRCGSLALGLLPTRR